MLDTELLTVLMALESRCPAVRLWCSPVSLLCNAVRGVTSLEANGLDRASTNVIFTSGCTNSAATPALTIAGLCCSGGVNPPLRNAL